MNNRLMFRPDLMECILEERISPAIANLGIIVLTTNGYTLLTPFPGASSSGAASSVATSAQPVSGVAIPTSLYITGTAGISSVRPGNITGVPTLAGGAGAAAGAFGLTITVGSGAEESGGSGGSSGGAPSAAVNRNNVADPTRPPLMTIIGGQTGGTNSPVLPPGQSYRDSAPVQPSPYGMPAAPASTSTSRPTGGSMNDPFAPNPMSGAPTLGPSSSGNRGGMGGRMPGTIVPMGPGGL
jgi:hypothetical protein